MNVTILIDESQKTKLLLESKGTKFSKIIEKNYDLVKKVLSESSKQINMDLKFLVTWGATLGGMIGPINDFVKGNFPTINDIQLSLILTGVIATYYFENTELTQKLYKKLKEEGIFGIFMKVVKKSDELINAFLDFVESLGITLHKFTNMISYSFLIPVIPMIYDICTNEIGNDKEVSEIIYRFLSFGLVAVTGVLLKELILKIVKRFRRRDV